MERKIFELAQINATENLRIAELKSQNINNNLDQILLELQTLTKLKTIPNYLEMFDVSNLADEFIAGAVVVYKNGRPVRSEFRKYNIQIDQKDDLHRLENMIYRRFQKKISTKQDLPTLIIIDGGITHVHFIKKIIENFGLENNVNVIGLVKNIHHKTEAIIDINEQKILLDTKTPIYNFLSEIQIRVDAYAKSGVNLKQKNNLIHSPLLNIEGLGKKKVQELYKTFLTIYEMKSANFTQLNKIIKNKITTQKLINYLSTNVI